MNFAQVPCEPHEKNETNDVEHLYTNYNTVAGKAIESKSLGLCL